MNRPLVAIVGRPNVGKSTLFNRMVGNRKSIVGDEPGITRDRIYGEVEWRSRFFELVDTGGIVPNDKAVIPINIFKQAVYAMSQAQAIIWVVDARDGITSLDEELAILLRNTGKPIFMAVNKAESKKTREGAADFYRFGFRLKSISAEHGLNIGDLLDEIFNSIDFADEELREEGEGIKFAVIGRPNVGKSSIINKILGEERAIVSPTSGTTRDAVNTRLIIGDRKFLLIDTSGIRRKGKTKEMAEKLSVLMARKSLEQADVAILAIDAKEGIANIDASIAKYAVDSGCSVIVVVNKWDLIKSKETGTASVFERKFRNKIKFLDWAPVITISALTGQRVTRILSLVEQANKARNLRIPTSQLNIFFKDGIMHPKGGEISPGKSGKKRVSVKYITQAGIRPPIFILFTSGGNRGLHFSYLRHVENRLRDEFDFFATPIKMVERNKSGFKNKK